MSPHIVLGDDGQFRQIGGRFEIFRGKTNLVEHVLVKMDFVIGPLNLSAQEIVAHLNQGLPWLPEALGHVQ